MKGPVQGSVLAGCIFIPFIASVLNGKLINMSKMNTETEPEYVLVSTVFHCGWEIGIRSFRNNIYFLHKSCPRFTYFLLSYKFDNKGIFKQFGDRFQIECIFWEVLKLAAGTHTSKSGNSLQELAMVCAEQSLQFPKQMFALCSSQVTPIRKDQHWRCLYNAHTSLNSLQKYHCGLIYLILVYMLT